MKNVEELIQSYWNKEPGADNELINHFESKVKGLAYTIFNSNKGISIDIDDYIQAGYLGIFNACDDYKVKGLPECIEGSMYLYIKNNIYRCREKFNNKRGAIFESIDEIKDDNYSLSELLADESSIEPFEIVEKCIDDKIIRKELNKILKAKFDALTREVIQMKYGWYTAPRSNDYISEELNVDKNTVTSIHSRAISRFRNLEWTEKIGVLYLYGYKIKNVKKIIKRNNTEENNTNLKLYTNLINGHVEDLIDLKGKWGI